MTKIKLKHRKPNQFLQALTNGAQRNPTRKNSKKQNKPKHPLNYTQKTEH